MKIYTRINYLISIIVPILIYNLIIKDKISFIFMFLFCQHFLSNFLGLLIVDENLLEEYWEIIIGDIKTLYKETKNIIKFYLNL